MHKPAKLDIDILLAPNLDPFSKKTLKRADIDAFTTVLFLLNKSRILSCSYLPLL